MIMSRSVFVGSTSACHKIFSPRLLNSSITSFPHVGTNSCPLLPTCSDGTLRTINVARNKERRPTNVFHADDQTPPPNSLCEMSSHTALPGILRLFKPQNVIATFMNLPLCAGLYRAHCVNALPLQVS
ncbi:hypothetical protein TNCV_3146931 [Trichonephila clavipes]|nr:hypothetical protein TNCV_3146931 [Trichonephila clavipes]